MTITIPAAPTVDGAHDFDFLHGAWRVRNRRLRRALAGCTEWYAFDGRTIERPLWDGQANVEEYDATLPDGTRLRGLALRLHDPHARQWTIHWSNAATGTLDAPMTGTFAEGVGEFLGRDVHDGRDVRVRFRWTSDGPDAARWEQAFSDDDGATWETNWIMEFARERCAVVELRRYTLHAGRRDELIALFEREFVESQEEAGIALLGTYRDLDRPDAFVWLRGFADLPSRAASLGAFYDGPVWARHRDAANATMIDSDDVRLLRPARPGSGITLGGRPASGLVAATVCALAPGAAGDFAAFFERDVAPRLVAAGARIVGAYETEPGANTFPRLPVREGERAFVWLAWLDDAAAHARHVDALAADAAWSDAVQPALARRLVAPAETWRLVPTARSRHVA